jgi:ribosomal protein S18 acetylase RimI-like enzyme
VPNDFALRWATPADAASLARAAAAFFADTFAPDNRPEDMDAYVSSAFSEERQRHELSDPTNRILLALDTGESLAGYAHLKVGTRPASGALPNVSTKRTVEIARLYADRRWHGRGLGGLLMDSCLAAGREWGAELVWLGVWERNARAIAFYQKHGFRVVGEQSFLLGADQQRDLVMAIHLTSEDRRDAAL